MEVGVKARPSVVMNTHSLTNGDSKRPDCNNVNIHCFALRRKEGYRPLSVEVKNTSTGKIERIELGHDELFEKEQITEEDVDVSPA